MPKYPDTDFAQFLGFVKQANSHFERFKDSALHPLITQLKHATCTPDKVRTLVGMIPDDKKTKYKAALDYLQKSYLAPVIATPTIPQRPPVQGGVRVGPVPAPNALAGLRPVTPAPVLVAPVGAVTLV